jgi:Rieske Fe-S protein
MHEGSVFIPGRLLATQQAEVAHARLGQDGVALMEAGLPATIDPLRYLAGLAYIGRAPGEKGNVFLATVTHGTIAGLLLGDLVLGVDSPWTELYDPARTPVDAVRELVVENLDVAWQYLDWIGPADVRSPEQIPPGSGAVLRRGPHRVAVLRDESGELHELSAKCTHLQCVVRWNPWDCPCHGSRFARQQRDQRTRGPTALALQEALIPLGGLTGSPKNGPPDAFVD